MRPLSNEQIWETLRWIHFLGEMPGRQFTAAELGRELGLSGRGADERMRVLRKQGLVTWEPRGPRRLTDEGLAWITPVTFIDDFADYNPPPDPWQRFVDWLKSLFGGRR